MNKQQQAIEKRIEALEPIELTPFERLQWEKRNWSDRANGALQRVHEIQHTIKLYEDGERNTILLENVPAKAAEIASLYAQLELLDGIYKGAQSRVDRLTTDIQNSGVNIPPRVLQYRLLRQDLWALGLRMQELSSILPQNRAKDWDETYKTVNDAFIRTAQEIEQYGDVAAEEELRQKMRKSE